MLEALGTSILVALSLLTATTNEVKAEDTEEKYLNERIDMYVIKHYEKLEVGEKIEIITKNEKVVFRRNIQSVLVGEIEKIKVDK